MKQLFYLLIFIGLLGLFSLNLDTASAQTQSIVIDSVLVVPENRVVFTDPRPGMADISDIDQIDTYIVEDFNRPPGTQVTLSSTPDGDGEIAVDNFVWINPDTGQVLTAENNLCFSLPTITVIDHDHSCFNRVKDFFDDDPSQPIDFYDDDTDEPNGQYIGEAVEKILEPIPAIDVTQYIPVGESDVEIILGDYGVIKGNTSLYLVVVQDFSCNLTNFSLIEVTDAPIDHPIPGYNPFLNGAEISINDLPPNVSIRANGSGEDIGSVRFELSGPVDVSSAPENTKPWALWGNNGENYNGNSLLSGSYLLIASAYTEPDYGGFICDRISIRFTITTDEEPAPVCEIISFSLLDSVENEVVLDSIPDNVVFGLDVLPSEVSIRANWSGLVESVELTLTGPVSYPPNIENDDPFTLFRNNNEDYLGQSLPVGVYELTANAYTEDDLGGELCATSMITFTISEESSPPPPPPTCPAEVTGFQFVSENTRYSFDFVDDNTIDLAEFSSGLNFVANTNDVTDEVFLILEGAYNHQNPEGTPPFSLFGNEGEDYFAWDAVIGNYTLSATPSADGVACEESAISFSIIDSSAP